jgi:hypothetical protein
MRGVGAWAEKRSEGWGEWIGADPAAFEVADPP